MKINLKYVFIVIISLVLYSCSSSSTTTTQSVKNTKWMLESIYGERIDTMYLTPNNAISLNLLDSNQMNGKAPCNSYFSGYQVSGQTISFGAIGATRMACDNLDMEQKYFEFLGGVTRYSLSNNSSGNRLTLYSTVDGVSTTATFARIY
jgi:heat shock protein HslJ